MNKRKILITDGMSDYRGIIITDAPRREIIKWAKNYNKEIENGENTWLDPLAEKFYVEVLYDSELDRYKDVDDIGYDEGYDLAQYIQV